MVLIKPKKNEHIDSLLKRFRRKVDQSGVMAEVYYRKYHRKPSLEKKEPKQKKWKKR